MEITRAPEKTYSGNQLPVLDALYAFIDDQPQFHSGTCRKRQKWKTLVRISQCGV